MSYQELVYRDKTAFPLASNDSKSWQFASIGTDDSNDLVCINKQGNSKMVELMVARDDNLWKLLEEPIKTCFTADEAKDGHFFLTSWTDEDEKDDLIFVQTRNTKSKHVEISVAPASSNYSTKCYEKVTVVGTNARPLSRSETRLSMSDRGDLIIFTPSSDKTYQEYIMVNRSSDYQYNSHYYRTPATPPDYIGVPRYNRPNEGIPDLYCVYISTTQSDADKNKLTTTTKIHGYTAQSEFKEKFLEANLPEKYGDKWNGVWMLANCTNTAFLDLVFLKTSNTLSGQVEISIFQG